MIGEKKLEDGKKKNPRTPYFEPNSITSSISFLLSRGLRPKDLDQIKLFSYEVIYWPSPHFFRITASPRVARIFTT